MLSGLMIPYIMQQIYRSAKMVLINYLLSLIFSVSMFLILRLQMVSLMLLALWKRLKGFKLQSKMYKPEFLQRKMSLIENSIIK